MRKQSDSNVGVAEAASAPRQARQRVHGHLGVLDGLRGVAILLVLVFHALPYRPPQGVIDRIVNGAVGMGWAGVDLFFVLSGFLITGILYDSKGTRHYFRNFYARRTLRIFPLYYAVIAVCVFVLPRFPSPLSEAAPQGSTWWWWLYLSNIRTTFWPDERAGALGVCWSLAIEEHFYLVWPAVIYLCSRRHALTVCGTCIGVASLARLAFVARGDVLAPYAFTPCRIDSLACGALAALALRGPASPESLARTALRLVAVTGPALLGVAIWRHSFSRDPIMQVLGLPLVALFCSSALVVAILSSSRSAIVTICESRVLKTFGKYSYGLYLLHMIVDPTLECLRIRKSVLSAFNGSRWGDGVYVLVVVAATLVAALVSWHLWEKHFLRLKALFPREAPASAIGRKSYMDLRAETRSEAVVDVVTS